MVGIQNVNYLKWIFLPALIFSQVVNADCPAEDESIALKGKLMEKVYAGPPNYESIETGDEALNYSILELDEPISCTVDNEELTVSDVQTIASTKSQVSNAELSGMVGKNIVVTGKAMYAQTGRHATPILVLVDEAGVIEPIKTASQKKSVLLQFQRFQQVLRERNVAELKTFFVFPFDGHLYDFMFYDESLNYSTPFTEKLFDKFSDAIIKGLQPLVDIKLNFTDYTVNEHRINSLSEEAQKRQYHLASEDGRYYYLENGKRHEVGVVCDDVAGGRLDENSLWVFRGSDSNAQLPDFPEYCEHSSGYVFNLINGKLRLIKSYSAG